MGKILTINSLLIDMFCTNCKDDIGFILTCRACRTISGSQHLQTTKNWFSNLALLMKLWIFLVFLFCYKTILFLPLNHRTPSHINSELLLSSLTMAFIDKIKMPMSLIASIRLALWNIPSQPC